jgi:hypothetical protein
VGRRERTEVEEFEGCLKTYYGVWVRDGISVALTGRRTMSGLLGNVETHREPLKRSVVGAPKPVRAQRAVREMAFENMLTKYGTSKEDRRENGTGSAAPRGILCRQSGEIAKTRTSV